jgi:GNAT superfamily N-acetyltransferase
MTIEIRRLRPEDDRRGFQSTDIDLDRFFQRYAGQNQFRHHIGTTYIALEGEHIAGFATIAPSEIDVLALPGKARRRLPGYPLPVLRLARLAVDAPQQGRGIGKALLRSVFVLARRMSHDFGCVGVVVDSKPDAIAFYARYGFAALDTVSGFLGDRPKPTPMFLEIGAIPEIGEDPMGPEGRGG